MKKVRYIILLFPVLLLAGCLNDDFLDRKPNDKLTEETLFVENENFETYA